MSHLNQPNRNYAKKSENFIGSFPKDDTNSSQNYSYRKSKIHIDTQSFSKISKGESNSILPMISPHQGDHMKKTILRTDKSFPLLNLLSNRKFKHDSESYLNNFMMDRLMKRKIYEFEFRDINKMKCKKNITDYKKNSLIMINAVDSFPDFYLNNKTDDNNNNQNEQSNNNFSKNSPKSGKIKQYSSRNYLITNNKSELSTTNGNNTTAVIFNTQPKYEDDKNKVEFYKIKNYDDVVIKKAKIQLNKFSKKNRLEEGIKNKTLRVY